MEKHVFRCSLCGDYFTPSDEEINLFLDGETERPHTCEMCANNQSFDYSEIYEFSDAEQGL